MDSLLARIIALWTRSRLEPADVGARLRDSAAPVCYVLERRSAVDLAVKEDKDYVADEAKLVQLKTQLTGQQAQLAQARKAEEDARIQAEKSRSSSGGSGSSGRR